MSALTTLLRRYARSTTLSARTAATKALQDSGQLVELGTDDAAFSVLIGSPTIGAGASAQESPVILALPVLTRRRDVIALAFQRYHQVPEVDAVREHPLFPAELDASLLDRSVFNERPPLALDRWLTQPKVDWAEVVATVADVPEIRRRIGPPSPFLPSWVPHIDRFAARFRASDRARWVLRSCGFVGTLGLSYMQEFGLTDEARALGSELDALSLHPDELVRAVVSQLR